MSDDAQRRGPEDDTGSATSHGQGAEPQPSRGPRGLPKRTAGGPGPAQKRRPSRQQAADSAQEHSALDPAAPFGRRFQSLGDRIGAASRPAKPDDRPANAGDPENPGDGAATTGGIPPVGPAPDISFFDQPPPPPRQPAKKSPVTVHVKPADEPRRPSRRRMGAIVGSAVGAVLLIGGVIFAVLPHGEQVDRSAKPFDLGTEAGSVSEDAGSPGERAPGAPKTTTSVRPDGKTITVIETPSPDGHPTPAGGDKRAPGNGGSKTTNDERPGSPQDGKADSRVDEEKSTAGKDPAPPADDPWPGGVQVYNHASGRCMGIVGGSGAVSGAQLEIRDCQDVSWQRWTFMSDGTVRSQGKCMNVGGGATTNGAGIGWVTCNGSGAQQFRLNAAHDITNPQSGNKCVDVRDMQTANGARLQLWTCGGTDNQKWSTR